MELVLPKWYDLHAHFRQGPNVGRFIADHLAMGCEGGLAMPNTKPPVAKVAGADTERARSIESYRAELLAAGADAFKVLITPLYLTRETTAEMIATGASSGLLQACKYYPPHGTTNAEHGVAMEEWIGSDVFRAMEQHGVVLCIHGEQHGLSGPEFFDAAATAESRFYQERLPRLLEAHPGLRIVCEHITTQVAADFVASAPEHVGATITPQHLLFTVGHLLQGFRYHLYCMPVVKFEKDREALRRAVLRTDQAKFFAGTDSAPHTSKFTECGCAAGCYTGGCAPQLYAMAFEQGGMDLSSREGVLAMTRFLSTNGPEFYRMESSRDVFTMTRNPSETKVMITGEGPIVPLPSGMGFSLEWSISPASAAG